VTVSATSRAAIKFSFWAALAAALLEVVFSLHTSGRLAKWYYYQAEEDGYVVNADAFMDATPDHPARLTIGSFDRLDGRQAVRVKKGDLLPTGANGIISDQVVAEGKRAALVGGQLQVTRPWVMEDAKGFLFRNTFQHKGIKTWPWAAVYNVLLVAGLGLSLGYMAEGFTDLIGVRPEKIRHFEDR